jgi:ABC-type nitrate/sulfonate/bicarbonate transport system permease component
VRKFSPRNVLATVLPLAAFVALWWVVATYWIQSEITLPSPVATLERAGTLLGDGTLAAAAGSTLENVLLAYGLAVIVGLPAGLALGRLEMFRLMFGPVVAFLFTAPKSAFYPAILVVFGLGATSKVVFGFALAVFQIVISTAAAASQIEERLLWSARSLRTSRLGVFVRVVLPATAPGAMAGARIGLVGAVVGVFLGEMVSGAEGLGQLMVRARSTLDSPTVYVAIVGIAAIAVVLDSVVVAASRRVFRWAEQE